MENEDIAMKYFKELIENSPLVFLKNFDSINKGTYSVLLYLDHHQEEVISLDLSNALNVSTARMAKLLQNMEKKNLIIKRKSNSDARKTVVQLSEKGKKVIDTYIELSIKNVNKVINEIGEEQLKLFIEIGSKIKTIAEGEYESLQMMNIINEL